MRSNQSNRHTLVVAVGWCVLVAACHGGSAAPIAADGPLAIRAGSGNHQVVQAGNGPLPAPVTIQVGYLPNGQVALRQRVLDAVLPEKAYAQGTVLKGIAGQLVCAVAPDPALALTPQVPCQIADALGNATFNFDHGTKAGVARAQARATVSGATVVTDSVTATILPGAASTLDAAYHAWFVVNGAKMGIASLVVRARDQYGNTVPTIPTVTGSGQFTVVGDSILAPSTERIGTVTMSLGAATASTMLTAVYDFRIRPWRIVGRCGPAQGFTHGEFFIDSLSFDMTTTGVQYTSAGSGDPLLNFLWHGSVVWYVRPMTAPDTHTVVTDTLPVAYAPWRQSVDSLVLAGNGIAALRDGTQARRTYVRPWVNLSNPLGCPLAPANATWTLVEQ
jgi:hypothetical protein